MGGSCRPVNECQLTININVVSVTLERVSAASTALATRKATDNEAE